MTVVHATSVAIDGRAILITGASGSGKSDLALRLIDRGATLISDDYTDVSVENGALLASAPPTIAGQFEVRGIGIVALPAAGPAPIILIVRSGTPERMPEATTCDMAGLMIPAVTLSFLEASAPLKVELAVRELRV